LAIAGAGVAGAYAYRLLRDRGYPADLYDVKKKTRCGISPCAWGTSGEFIDLVKVAGLDPSQYILERVDQVVIDGIRFKIEMITIDKPRFVRDLLQGAGVSYGPVDLEAYSRVIDATGVSRALLSPIRGDVFMPCFQSRIETRRELEARIILGEIGYAWCFPLGENHYHIGCGSLVKDPHDVLRSLDLMGGQSSKGDTTICSCRGRIRLTGPHLSLPFVSDRSADGIWGVGEAIGCVGPMAGDGIVPSMKTVRILLKEWDDPEAYTRSILEEFHWMEGERTLVDKLRNMEQPTIANARVLLENSKRMGMRIGLKEVTSLMNNLRVKSPPSSTSWRDSLPLRRGQTVWIASCKGSLSTSFLLETG